MPNNQEAEQAILGAMLASPEHARKAVEELKPDDFFWDNNREIFNALVALSDDLVPLDMVTLVNELSKRGTFEIVGGLEYISTIMDIVPVKANIDNYIDICTISGQRLVYRVVNNLVYKMVQTPRSNISDIH